MTEKFVKNGDTDIQYLVCNYSPAESPLIIIPGAVNGAEDIYNDIKDHLDIYAIIISIRGRGKSSSPVSGYSMAHQVSDIESVANAEALDEFYLCGHSFGASLAYAFSIEYPHKVKALVGMDFPVLFPAYPEKWAEYIRENVEGVSENFLNGMVNEGKYEELTDKLAITDCRKLFIKGGGSDSLLKEKAMEEIKEKIPDANIITINGAGHELFMEKPYETLEEIKNFIS